MSHLKGPDVPHLNFNPTTSVLKLLHKALESYGREIALIEGQSGCTISYADILKQSSCVAAGLQSQGVTAGQVVVVCCEKSIVAFSVLIGVIFTGATAALVPTSSGDLIPQLTQGHSVKAIFYDADNQERVSKSVAAMTPAPSLVVTTDPRDPLLASLLNSTSELSMYEVQDVATHVAIVLYSSGTTGIPKGVELTDLTLQKAAAPRTPVPKSQQYKSQLNASAMYWTSGLFMWLSAILQKRLLVLSNSLDAMVNLRLTQQYQVEAWFIVMGAMQRYIYEQTQQDFDLSSLRRVFSGGETILENPAKEFVEKVLKNKVKLEIMYGSSEAGVVTYNNNHQLVDSNKVVSSGKVLPGAEIKIVGEDGEVVPLGSLGEIWVRSVNMTTGYWNKPELNDQLFDDKFLRTGDIGHFDEDGNLYVLGRVVDAISFQGTKMFPTALENELTSHEAVVEAVVVGATTSSPPRLDAFVILKPGTQVSEDQLRAYLQGKVEPSQMLTGRIHFLDVLPRTVIGKVARSKLRELKRCHV